MKTAGFRAMQPRSYQPRTTESRHRLGYNQNLLAGRAVPERLNEVRVGDITYIPLATLEGVSSARRLAVLCERDLADQWICGEVGVNRDLLNTFRCAHPDALEELLIETIATLRQQELVPLECVAQDGMRVRAAAGTSSFLRQDMLERHLQEVREQVELLRQVRDEDDPGDADPQRQAARERVDREHVERIQSAPAEQQRRQSGSRAEARASTTDPQDHNMKMADGGYRPAYVV